MARYKRRIKCNCDRQHKRWDTVARCIWPMVYPTIVGDGRWVVLAWCSSGPTRERTCLSIHLHETMEDAEAAKKFIDPTGCGGKCDGAGRHDIVELHPDLLGKAQLTLRI